VGPRSGVRSVLKSGRHSGRLTRPGSTRSKPSNRSVICVLDGYAAAGGRYREAVIKDAGHGPHLDQPEEFLAELTRHLADA
jgi:pimeloyl-ACP methyl ester carboxylesterase